MDTTANQRRRHLLAALGVMAGLPRPPPAAHPPRLYRKGEDAGYSQQSINDWILKKYGQQDPHNLTRAQYDEACAAMDNAKQQGGQDNA